MELFPHSPKKIEVVSIASSSDPPPLETPDVFDTNPQVPEVSSGADEMPGPSKPVQAEGDDEAAAAESTGAMDCSEEPTAAAVAQGETATEKSDATPDPNNNTIPAEDDGTADGVLELMDDDLEKDLGGEGSSPRPTKTPLRQYFTSEYQAQQAGTSAAPGAAPEAAQASGTAPALVGSPAVSEAPRERKDTRREGKKSNRGVGDANNRSRSSSQHRPRSSPGRAAREQVPLPPPPQTAESPKKRRKMADGGDDGRDRRRRTPDSRGQPSQSDRPAQGVRDREQRGRDHRGSGSTSGRRPPPPKGPPRSYSPQRRQPSRGAYAHPANRSGRSRSPRPSPTRRSGTPGRKGQARGRSPAPGGGARKPFYSSYRSTPIPRMPLDLGQGPSQTGGTFQEADLRSKLLHNLPHSAHQVAAEATARAKQGARSSAFPKLDNNVQLSNKVQGEAAKKGFLVEHRNLPVAESDASVRNRSLAPLDKTRLDQVHLNHFDRYNNRFATHPFFESRCDFCGSRHCSKFTTGSMVPNCTRYRQHLSMAPTRSICNYRRCSRPTEHHTQVCPSLHQRCPRCLCRGHGPGDGCDVTNADVMDRLRADFESVADEGAYTRERRLQLSWGWYPYPRGAPVDFAPTSYDDLTEMHVLTAITYLGNLLQQAENSGHFPDPGPAGDYRPGGSGGPPPPPPPAGAAGAAPVPV